MVEPLLLQRVFLSLRRVDTFPAWSCLAILVRSNCDEPISLRTYLFLYLLSLTIHEDVAMHRWQQMNKLHWQIKTSRPAQSNLKPRLHGLIEIIILRQKISHFFNSFVDLSSFLHIILQSIQLTIGLYTFHHSVQLWTANLPDNYGYFTLEPVCTDCAKLSFWRTKGIPDLQTPCCCWFFSPSCFLLLSFSLPLYWQRILFTSARAFSFRGTGGVYFATSFVVEIN